MMLRDQSVFAESHDLHGAAIALIRLQDTYKLNVTALADGRYTGVDQSKEQGYLSAFLSFFKINCMHSKAISVS